MKAGPNDQHRVVLLAAIASAELFRAFLDDTRTGQAMATPGAAAAFFP